MKIAYLGNSAVPSRAANSIHVMKMCQALGKEGHDVHLFVPLIRDASQKAVQDVFRFYNVDRCFRIVEVKSFSNAAKGIPYRLSRMVSSLLMIPDLIKFHPNLVFGRNLPGCFLSVTMGYRTIFETHTPIAPGGTKNFLFKWMAKRTKLVRLIVITKILNNELIRQYPFLEDKFLTIPDGSDEVTDFSRVNPWPGRNNVLQVGYVGNLYPGKGMEIVTQLCFRLTDVDFHVIGGMETDIAHWKQKIDAPNLFFHGYVSQHMLSRYINTLDICLLPNQEKVLTHGFNRRVSPNISSYTSPLKMFEYMAHGKAIIASDLPVLREVLNDSNAVLVAHDNLQAWQTTITSLKDEHLRDSLGKAALRDFTQKYTWTQRAQRVLDGI